LRRFGHLSGRFLPAVEREQGSWTRVPEVLWGVPAIKKERGIQGGWEIQRLDLEIRPAI